MRNLIMTGFIALCSIASFAGNGETEINQLSISNIENSIDNSQISNDSEPTYIYEFSLWFYLSDGSGTGTSYGHKIAITETCITEAEMEQMRSAYLFIYQLQYPGQNIIITANQIESCD